MFKAVCFDFDYTLADCTDSIVAGFQHGLTGLGWPAPDREAVRRTIGFLLEDAYSMLTGDLDPENQARFRALFSEVAVERQWEETVLLPGGEELLWGLKERGVRIAIVSTKRGDTIEMILDRLGIADTVDLVVGSADVVRHKPDPEGLLSALGQLLSQHGWTWLTACCTMLFSLFHWPCSTTCLTICKETGRVKWTALSVLLPTALGLGLCLCLTAAARLLGIA